MLSPRVLVRGNPARAKFAAENWIQLHLIMFHSLKAMLFIVSLCMKNFLL